MSLCVKEMNVKNVVFIADKGFYSLTNITQLKDDQLHYIIPMQRTNSLIDFTPLLKFNFKKQLTGFFKYQERIIWYYAYQREGPQLVTFLDDKLKVKEETDYLLRVKSHPAQNTEDKFYEKLPRFGTLTLI